MAKAAKLAADVAAVDAEAELAGIDVVDADAEFLENARLQIHTQAEVHNCSIKPLDELN